LEKLALGRPAAAGDVAGVDGPARIGIISNPVPYRRGGGATLQYLPDSAVSPDHASEVGGDIADQLDDSIKITEKVTRVDRLVVCNSIPEEPKLVEVAVQVLANPFKGGERPVERRAPEFVFVRSTGSTSCQEGHPEAKLQFGDNPAGSDLFSARVQPLETFFDHNFAVIVKSNRG
jgi:hypothetical protein